MRSITSIVFLTALAASMPRAEANPLVWRNAQLEGKVEIEPHIFKRLNPIVEAEFLHPIGVETYHGSLTGGAMFKWSKDTSFGLLLGVEETRDEIRGHREFVAKVKKHTAFPEHRIRLHFEQEHRFGHEGYAYHGRYVADFRLLELLTSDDAAIVDQKLKLKLSGSTLGVQGPLRINPMSVDIGPQVDHLMEVVDFGYHVAISRPNSPWRVEFQHYMGLQDENHGQFMRFSLKFRF